MMTQQPLDEANPRCPLPQPELADRHATTDPERIDLLDVLIVVAERKRVVFWFTAISAVIAIAVSLLLPSRYTATATLLPPQQNSSIGNALASQLGSVGGMASLAGGSLGIKNPNDMYVAMLKSRTVEDAMVQQFGMMKEYEKRYPSDARKVFEQHATVDGSGKDGLINVSFEDHDPRRAADIANGYVNQLRELSQHLAITEASQRRLFFERELDQAKNNLAGAEEALKQTELATGLIQPDSQARALIESAATLRAQITAREVEIQGMQTYATGQNPQLIQAQREVDSMRAQLAKLGGTDGSNGGEFMVPKGRVPETGMEYVRKLRDVKYYETIFDILARQFEVAKLDEAKQGALIQVVDPAIPPDRRSFPKRSLIVLGAILFGLIIGIAVVIVQASWGNVRRNPEVSAKVDRLLWSLTRRKGPARAS